MPSISKNTTDYAEIPEIPGYENLTQNNQVKCYENDAENRVHGISYFSLKPEVMETIRDHIQSTVSLTSHITLTTTSLKYYTSASLMPVVREASRGIGKC